MELASSASRLLLSGGEKYVYRHKKKESIQIGEYTYSLSQPLGYGKFGEVWQAAGIVGFVAIKFMQLLSAQTLKMFKNEVNAMLLLQQTPYAVHIIAHSNLHVLNVGGEGIIVQQFIDGKDLHTQINKPQENELEALKYIHKMATQISNPLKELNLHKWAYHDLNDGNVFTIFRDGQVEEFYLGDYGLAASYQTDGSDQIKITHEISLRGTPLFISKWFIDALTRGRDPQTGLCYLPPNLKNVAVIDVGSLAMLMLWEYSQMCDVNALIDNTLEEIYRTNQLCQISKNIFQTGETNLVRYFQTNTGRTDLWSIAKKAVHDSLEHELFTLFEMFIPADTLQSPLNQRSEQKVWNLFENMLTLLGKRLNRMDILD